MSSLIHLFLRLKTMLMVGVRYESIRLFTETPAKQTGQLGGMLYYVHHSEGYVAAD